jgi:hypothetical protein
MGMLVRMGMISAPIVIAGLAWAAYHKQLIRNTPLQAGAASLSSAVAPPTRTDLPTRTAPGDSQDAVLLSSLPLASVPALPESVDSAPPDSVRELMAPPGSPRAVAQVDPRAVRTVLDRGVVAYASAATDADRAKGVSLIQIAALVGYPPARELLARNYPQSEAVRTAVPANDAIRYAVGLLMESATASDDLKQVFLLLVRHFSTRGQLDLFAAHLLNSLRSDVHPQLSHRIDTLLGVLAHVRGACSALARLVITTDASLQDCSITLAESLRRHIETTPSAGEDEEARHRGLVLFNQLGLR